MKREIQGYVKNTYFLKVLIVCSVFFGFSSLFLMNNSSCYDTAIPDKKPREDSVENFETEKKYDSF